MEKCKILEVLANSFMVKTLKNTPHTLFDFAYFRSFSHFFSGKTTPDDSLSVFLLSIPDCSLSVSCISFPRQLPQMTVYYSFYHFYSRTTTPVDSLSVYPISILGQQPPMTVYHFLPFLFQDNQPRWLEQSLQMAAYQFLSFLFQDNYSRWQPISFSPF